MATNVRPQQKSLNLWQKFTRAINPLMLWLLKSPLHFLVSKSYLVLNVTGRKSGKVYTLPIQYHQQGHVLMLLTSRDYQWWKNLIGNTEVTLSLRGKTVRGRTTISINPDVIINVFGKMYPSSKLEMREKFANSGVVVYVTICE